MNRAISTSGESNKRTKELLHSLERNLPFQATETQQQAMVVLSRFLASNKDRCALVLTGFAGTGKTSLMQSLVRTMGERKWRFALMAPTGRAAKVLSSYTRMPAFTIHKSIYRRVPSADGGMRFSLKENTWRNRLFIVDEASMISSGGMMGRDLLGDLMQFIYSSSGCRLLLIGDSAQLPPVHSERSPALEVDSLRLHFDLRIARTHLSQVVRQAEGSGILELATALRYKIEGDDGPLSALDIDALSDVRVINGEEMLELLEGAYDREGIEQVKVLCRSNKNANDYNKHIRNRTLFLEEEIATGDQLMIVKNNYHWLGDESNQAFIANGDIAEVEYVKSYKDLYDLRFATVGLRFVDYDTDTSIECNVILDVLSVEGPSLDEERMNKLYEQVREDLSDHGSVAKVKQAMRADPWLNALQVKYGNAITCHKAQGGQWPIVFIDRGYITEEMMDTSYWRWLYTAVTRATDKLYLVNFKP